ncbi:MAG: lipoyl(octanoyl) transferase LipB [Planctomycetes bacterium]|nr:lipoyl(octanoyl) transferase LipB [Planctomycetota bacterium]
MSELEIERLGRVPYPEALALQLDLVQRRAADEIGDRLLLLEHDEVFTCGRGTDAASLPAAGTTPIVEISRGGNVTWHGPGQVVGYWIRKLEEGQRDLHAHLRLIESKLGEALARFGLVTRRDPEATGVWVGEAKVASIGVAVRRWVTFHGFALNRQVDPTVWSRFKPCGLAGSVMTDLAQLLGRAPELDEVLDAIELAFRG